jgi:hypothetical protein
VVAVIVGLHPPAVAAVQQRGQPLSVLFHAPEASQEEWNAWI